MVQLIVESGQPAGKAWALTSPVTSVGRGASNDIILSDNQVSRVHCLIELTGQRYVLTDKSTNGTLVNGRRARGQVTLKTGDRIQIGDIVLRFEPVPEAAGVQLPTEPVSDFLPSAAPFEPAVGGFAPAAGVDAAWAEPVVPVPMSSRSARTSNVIPVAIGVIGAIIIIAAVVAATMLLPRRSAALPTPTGQPVVVQETPQPAPTTEPAPTPSEEAEVRPTVEPTVLTGATIDGRIASEKGLNVRSGPAQNAPRLYTLANQAAVTIRGRTEASDWYLIQCAEDQPADTQCWVAAQYVELTQPGVDLPVVAP